MIRLHVPQPGQRGHFYFAIDPAFKSSGAQNVSIEIEFFSRTALDIGVEYDALAVPKTRREMYVMRTSQSRADSTEWQVATIHIFDGAFANSQNGGADFRAWTRRPDQYIRRVTVTREPYVRAR